MYFLACAEMRLIILLRPALLASLTVLAVVQQMRFSCSRGIFGSVHSLGSRLPESDLVLRSLAYGELVEGVPRHEEWWRVSVVSVGVVAGIKIDS